MVRRVLFKKAASDLSSYADLLNTTAGSHGVFISPILSLKWSPICDNEKCPVLRDQPSLTTNMFSHILSLCSDSEAPEVWQCCLLLCWAEDAAVGLTLLSVECRSGSTRSTRSWDLHGAADQGWAAQLGQWNQEGLGLSAWNPTTAPRAKPLWQPRAPLMGKHPRMAAWPHGSFKGTSWRRCRSSPEHPGSACCTAGEAGHSAGCTCCWGAVQQAVCAGVWSPIATKPQLRSWQAGITRFWTEGSRKNRQPFG